MSVISQKKKQLDGEEKQRAPEGGCVIPQVTGKMQGEVTRFRIQVEGEGCESKPQMTGGGQGEKSGET